MLAIFYCLCPYQVFGQTPGAEVFHINETITADGRLDEPAWKSAKPIGNLIQVIPREGEAPRERTEVRVLVDSNALYFGITCFDSDPSSIISTQLTRDANLDVDDSVTIVIDPFFDQRNGFLFRVNPAGARADGQISNNAEFASLDWDGIWDASARVTDEGWTAEIVIPFKTLRFRPDTSVWGLNIERVHKRYNETSRWSGARRDIWISNLAEAGRLEGLPQIRQGMGLDIRPYGLITRREGNDWKFDGGLDVSKNLTPNLNASLTVNTDFAETEVDTRQVNLTRFPLFYPEKRSFFLEGAGVFDTATVAGTPRPDLIPFFSRRIGLTEDGRTEVPVIVGGKITGRQSGFNIGIMDVQTGSVDEIGLDGQNLFAARISRDLWKQSYIGGIFTSGNPSGQGGNTLVGADARFATSSFQGNKNLSLSLYVMRTDDEASDTSDYATGFAIEYPNDRWFANIGWKQIGENFRPALGFVPRAGMRKANAALMFRPRPGRGGIRQLVTHAFPEIVTNLDNRIDSWFINISPLEFRLESGDLFDFEIHPQFDRISNPAGFAINRNATIPAGSYQFTRYRAKVETATKRRWVVNLYTEFGNFYSGTRRDLNIELLLKPSNYVQLGFKAERADVNLEEGKFFTQLFSARADINFSPNTSWANIVQYDNSSRLLGFQTRFRWIIQPGSDLFLILNRGWEKSLDQRYVSIYNRGTAKLQYTFRF